MSTGSKAKTYRIRQLPCILTYPRQVASFLAGIVPDLAAEDVKVFSLATSLNPLEIPATKVATVMFSRVPPAFDNGGTQWVIPGQSAGLVRDILVDVHFQDFTPLNDVPQDDHVLDCIAISGLASHPFGSWMQRGSRATYMWLRDRLPREIPNVRSIIYGYDTALIGSESVKGVDDIAIALISKMKSIGRSSPSAKPLLMLAHSLGGIVLKQAMVTMARTGDSSNVMVDLIRSVVFFGVPNQGMKVSYLLPMVEDQPNAHIVHLLSTDSDYLQSLDRQFSGIVTHRGVRIMSVYETKRSATTQKSASGQWRRDGPLDLLVDKSSAIQQSSSQYMPIDEDHSNLVKFGADDQDCQAIINFMNATVANITSHSAKSTQVPSDFDHQSRSNSEEDDIHVMINSLDIEETGHRLNEIQAQYKSTFEWIFNDESLTFAEWLRSPNELYWISGKPGSGKSTLMKLARQDSRTYGFFRQHDPSASHIMIDFFFHDRGSSVQKSLEGLLYRMLYQLLNAERKLARLVLPIVASRSERKHLTWSLHDLRQALNIVLTQSTVPLRILLFLDALDEFDGEPQTIADFVKDLTRPRAGSSTEIKICCSSRPWNVFRDSFSNIAGCKVHEHTREDIQKYISGRFENNTRMRDMVAREKRGGDDTIQTLKYTLSTRAEGVFIWVRLVLDELLTACTDGAMPEELIQSLSSFPDDLDKSYQRLVDRIPVGYRFETYIMIETVLRSKDPFGVRDLGLTMLCALGNSPSDSAKKLPANPYSEEFLVATRRRLQSRCGGMLEVLEDTTVQFMHQTAKEFFSRPGSTEAILRHDPSLLRENGYSFLTKFYLTLASAKSQSFDWLAYILSISHERFGYVPHPHYLASYALLTSYRAYSEIPHDSIGSLHNIMSYAGFAPDVPKKRCLNYAYLSEVSTGRSQREFLNQTEDEAIRRLFCGNISIFPDQKFITLNTAEYYGGRSAFAQQVDSISSLLSFAENAGLRLFLDEVYGKGSERRRRQDKSSRRRPRGEPEGQTDWQQRPSAAYPRPERQRPHSQPYQASPSRREREPRRARHCDSADEADEYLSPEWAEPRYRPEGQPSWQRGRRSPDWQELQYQPQPGSQPHYPYQDGGIPEQQPPQYHPQGPYYHGPPPEWAIPRHPMPQYHPHGQPYRQPRQRQEWDIPPYLPPEEDGWYPPAEWDQRNLY